MNNYILISRAFTETTPESLDEGDFSGSGMLTDKEQVSFSELVKLMKEHTHASCSPNDYSTNVWYHTESYTRDYCKGIDREESMHYHADNSPNAAKYWKWARIIAEKQQVKRLAALR